MSTLLFSVNSNIMYRLLISLLILGEFNPLSASVALIKTSQLSYCANQLTGFYMRVTLALNGLSESRISISEFIKKP